MRAFTPQQLEVVVRRVLVEGAGRSTEYAGMPAWAVEAYKASANSMASPSGGGARYPDPCWGSKGSTWIDLDTPEYHHVSPHRGSRPQASARRRATFRRHRRGTTVVAEGAQAPVRDARLRGRRRGDAEAQGPRRCHAARRGQAGGAGRL